MESSFPRSVGSLENAGAACDLVRVQLSYSAKLSSRKRGVGCGVAALPQKEVGDGVGSIPEVDRCLGMAYRCESSQHSATISERSVRKSARGHYD